MRLWPAAQRARGLRGAALPAALTHARLIAQLRNCLIAALKREWRNISDIITASSAKS
jgi:hypothetical protein